jgi:hypothetical protein
MPVLLRVVMLASMKRMLPAIVAMGVLALTGCSAAPSVEGAAEECGGEPAGITISDDMLEYDESTDSTGDAWTCVIQELVTDQSDQFTITQSLDESLGAQDGEFGSLTAVWGVNAERGIQMSFWPTK